MENHKALYDMTSIEKITGICRAALESWETLHRDAAPQLVMVAFTDEEVIPCATTKPSSAHLRRVAAGILNLADRMDDDDAD